MTEKQYAHLAAHYDRLFPVTETTVAFLKTCFSTAQTILDVGCGTGLHAFALARAGKSVTGIDPDCAMLEQARKQGDAYPGSVRFLTGTLQSPGVSGVFAGIMVLGNTLPHLESEQALGQVMVKLAKRLEAGGTLLVQMINYDKVFKERLNALPMLQDGAVTLKRQVRLIPPHVDFTTDLEDGTSRQVRTVRLLGITRAMFLAALVQAGLKKVDEYGDFARKPYDIDTDLRWIIVAQKPRKGASNHAR
ncbi:MAG: class I SAM-dependent methyltransferase [Acholeplasmatales bacterium]|nr:MAG: class I SAM-dependent methyltransferase [Acholeplasmatales bacterium]